MLARFVKDVWKHLLGRRAREASKGDSHRLENDLPRVSEPEAQRVESLHARSCASQSAGQVEAAIDSVGNALTADARAARYHNTCGNLKYARGDLEGAAGEYAEALRRDPGFPEALTNLGMISCERGEIDRGVLLFQRAIDADAKQFAPYHNLGNARQALGELDAAAECYRQALKIRPEAVESLYGLGTSLAALGRHESALTAFQRALEFKPDHADAQYRMGKVLFEMGSHGEAWTCLKRATHLRPDHYEAYNGLGIIELERGHLDEAAAALGRAIGLRPDYAEAHNNLGMVLLQLGRADEAIASFRRALLTTPDLLDAHSNLIHALSFSSATVVAEEQAERRRWHAQHVRPKQFRLAPHGNSPDPDRKLRIGYVSADFRYHAASGVFGLMLLHYDRSRYEVICYSNSQREDELTARFRSSAGAWRTIAGISDETVAEMMRADGIDILVDLSGHSAGNRLLVFARKPAPVQVNAWGYANGTGLEEMDYLFSDEIMLPPDSRRYFSEEVVYLPCVLSYLPRDDAPAVSPPPFIRNGYVTFGFFNNPSKLSDEALGMWAKLLVEMTDARILFKGKGLDVPGQQRERVARKLRDAGVADERMRFIGATAWHEHMSAHNQVDIVLDPFPCGGGMSTLEALWMGVPLVTLPGSITARYSLSILNAVRMSDWVARTPREYLDILKSKAGDRQRLMSLRSELRQRLARSVLADPDIYVRAAEAAFRDIWRRWCEGRRPPARDTLGVKSNPDAFGPG